MKKENDHKLITEGFFRSELKKGLKREFETFGKSFKKEVKDDICLELRSEMDTKLGALYENLKDWKNEILKSNDSLAKKFVHFEKENASLHPNYKYVKSDVEGLQQRVTVLEKVA